MKCPYCSKEIKDDAVFCGFCGKQIPQKPLEEASPAPPIAEVKSEVSNDAEVLTKNEVSEETSSSEKAETVSIESADETPKKKSKDKPKKKRIALKVLMIFVVLAFIGGSVLGFLTARGIVSLESLIPNGNFKWTSFSEGQSETVESEKTSEDKDGEKEENSESSSPTDEEETPSTEPADSSSETTSPEDTQTPAENDAHYAKYIGDSLVVVDDKAHIWEESTIANILANAKAMSELSGYSIMIVVTNDMFDMTSQEFADDYYDYVLTSNEGDTELIADGYLFLINLADREYYLSTCGKAIDLYTDTVTDELFNEIQQFMVDENYEAAVNKVIEKTIY